MYEIQQTQNNGAALCINHQELWQKWSFICMGRLGEKGKQEFLGSDLSIATIQRPQQWKDSLDEHFSATWCLQTPSVGRGIPKWTA